MQEKIPKLGKKTCLSLLSLTGKFLALRFLLLVVFFTHTKFPLPRPCGCAFEF
jgi:hypothetical protein